MNVLVTYFSQSGNTEKIAEAICEEASKNHDADLKKLEDIGPEGFSGYDCIFLGSPLHSANLAAPVQDFLKNIPSGPGKNLACFITHFAPAYPDQDMNGFTEPVKAACSETGIAYKGSFNCQGALIESLHEAVQKKLNLSDEQWADMVKQMAGRPNKDDETDARVWARDILG